MTISGTAQWSVPISLTKPPASSRFIAHLHNSATNSHHNPEGIIGRKCVETLTNRLSSSSSASSTITGGSFNSISVPQPQLIWQINANFSEGEYSNAATISQLGDEAVSILSISSCGSIAEEDAIWDHLWNPNDGGANITVSGNVLQEERSDVGIGELDFLLDIPTDYPNNNNNNNINTATTMVIDQSSSYTSDMDSWKSLVVEEEEPWLVVSMEPKRKHKSQLGESDNIEMGSPSKKQATLEMTKTAYLEKRERNDKGETKPLKSLLKSLSNSPSKTLRSSRNGVATDPQSVAARTRREKVSRRLKILQSMLPHGEHLDTVAILGHTLEYIKFLQQQIRGLYQGCDPFSSLSIAQSEKWKDFM